MKLTPKHDLVVVEETERENKVGHIHLPDQVKRNREARAGRVLDVGPGRLSENGTFVPVTAKVGDIVLFTKNAGVAVDPEGRVRLVRDCELLGTLVDSPLIEIPSGLVTR